MQSGDGTDQGVTNHGSGWSGADGQRQVKAMTIADESRGNMPISGVPVSQGMDQDHGLSRGPGMQSSVPVHQMGHLRPAGPGVLSVAGGGGISGGMNRSQQAVQQPNPFVSGPGQANMAQMNIPN